MIRKRTANFHDIDLSNWFHYFIPRRMVGKWYKHVAISPFQVQLLPICKERESNTKAMTWETVESQSLLTVHPTGHEISNKRAYIVWVVIINNSGNWNCTQIARKLPGPRGIQSRVYVSDYYDSKYNFFAQQSRLCNYDESENGLAICGKCLFMGYCCA